ncbi:MAG: hydroxymethylbilane synthase, partial [Clostridia bacterium]
MFPREVRVGTRASLLALAQTRWVIARLQEAAPGVRFTVVTVRTEGDRDRSTPLPAMGGRGVFVREVERRLLQGDIDLAVHSLKDLPTEETPGLTVAAVA